MNDWSGTYVPGGARVNVSVTLSLSLSLLLTEAENQERSDPRSIRFRFVLVVGEKIRCAPGCTGITRAIGWCIARGSPITALATRARADPKRRSRR